MIACLTRGEAQRLASKNPKGCSNEVRAYPKGEVYSVSEYNELYSYESLRDIIGVSKEN